MNRIPCLHLAVFLLLFTQSFVFAQRDFNHYTTLLSKGPVPEDFTIPVAQKVKSDMLTRESDLTPTKKRIFLEGIHRNIDPILHSGAVIYGDEITEYVSSVAQNLLQNEPELQKNLRFYTIKSNAANALSTDQGIIFVTTGLISQLTSEAQLAYILSHEIAHYTEKHVTESFELYNSRIRTSERIETLSSHSRENELEADKLALKLYHGAGYDDDEIVSTFDVLMYSYLPFDEVELPKTYFRTEQLYIPDNLFATKEYPIKTDEDYDDDRSSHPNIRKRKDAVLAEIDAYSNWGTTINAQGEERFRYIRNLSRFESVRIDVIDGSYATALYSVFLLEKEFPQSVYLQQMKAHAWLGMMQLKGSDKFSESMPIAADYEGESAALYFFLRKLNTDALMTLAARTIYDTRQRFPEDSVIALIEDKLIHVLAKTSKFSWSDYSTQNFDASARAALLPKSDLANAETAAPTGSEPSKYDKIKTKKNVNAPESFDSSKFYLYGIPDIVADSAFRKKFERYRTAEKERKEHEEALAATKTKRKKGPDYAALPALNIDRAIIVEPISVCVNKKGVPQWAMKDRSQLMMQQAMDDAAEKEGIDLTPVNRNEFAINAEAYNQRSLLYSLAEQLAVKPDADLVPVDCELLYDIEKATGASTVLYTTSNYYYDSRVNYMVLFVGTVCYPLIPLTYLVYLPIAVSLSHRLDTSVLAIDMKTAEVRTAVFSEGHGKPAKGRYAKVYNPLFKRLSAPQ